jgi:Spy/CpxP family protein refolding chaperone
MGINSVPSALTGLTAKARRITPELQQQAMREAQEQVSGRILAGERLTPEQRATAERETYHTRVNALLAGQP